MPHISNPFMDFKYGDFYASDFHLIRVSDGSRYNDNLLPTLTDSTIEIPGGDGMYWFNTYYKQRQISVNVAFNGVTESDLRGIRNWLNGKQVKPLIFDEHDDRQYFAKITGSPQLKYIAFDEPIESKKSNNNNVSFGLKLLDSPSAETESLWHINGSVNNHPFIQIYIDEDYEVRFLDSEGELAYSTQYLFDATPPAWSRPNPNIDLIDASSAEGLEELINFTPPVTTQVIYKGEGTIQFTCYDPFAYALTPTTQTYQVSSTPQYIPTSVGVTGEYPTPFKVTCEDTLTAGAWIQVTDGTSTYKITLNENATYDGDEPIVWDSSTGIVYNAQRAINFTGNSMGTLAPNSVPIITASQDTTYVLSFYNRYL